MNETAAPPATSSSGPRTVASNGDRSAQAKKPVNGAKQQDSTAQKPKAVKPKSQPKQAASSSSSSSSSRPSLLSDPRFTGILIDIGANLSDDMFQGSYRGKDLHPADLDDVLARSHARGVERIIVTAGNSKESHNVQKLIKTAQANAKAAGSTIPLLYSTVGVHPTRSSEWNGSSQHQEQYLNHLKQALDAGLSTSPRTVVAIGECGLDYDRLHFSDKQSQLAHFDRHFALVEYVKEKYNMDIPLFLHDRNTGGDFARIMKENRHRFRHGVVHSFTGTIDELKVHLALDLYIGINGCSLKTADNLAALYHIPLDRLLLETDAPWCDIKNTHASAPLVSDGSKMLSASKPENWKKGMAVKSRNEPGNMVRQYNNGSSRQELSLRASALTYSLIRLSFFCSLQVQVLEVVSAHLGVDGIELAQIVHRNTLKVFFPDEVKDPQ